MHIIGYKTTCKVNGKYYIGVHSTDNLNDGYIGCGVSTLGDATEPVNYFHSAVRQEGYLSFSREILETFATYEDALKWEGEIVVQALVDDDNCYNTTLGGNGGSQPWSEEKKAYHASIGSYKKSSETKKKLSEAAKNREDKSRLFKSGKENPMYGKQFTEEERQKMGERVSERWTDEFKKEYSKRWSGKNSSLFGKSKSDSTKKKIAESLRKLPQAIQEEILRVYTGERGQKTKLAKEYSVSIDVITRLVGKSYSHKRKINKNGE